MTAQEFASKLRDLLASADEELLEEVELDGELETTSFRSAGLLTSDQGFVVRVGDQEFQVSVVRSR